MGTIQGVYLEIVRVSKKKKIDDVIKDDARLFKSTEVHILLIRFCKMLNQEIGTRIEPRHDQTKNMSVRPAKTQVSLGIRQV